MSNTQFKYTEREEKFCRLIVEGLGQSDAYRQAGYKTDSMKPATLHRKAKAMMDKSKIAARLAELREPIVKRHNVTVDSLMVELEEARKAALGAETPQSSAAVAATMGKAKLCGLDKQLIDVTSLGESVSPKHSGDAVLAALARKYDSE